MTKIRESHFRRDSFGVVRVFQDGTTQVVTRPDGSPLRLTSGRDAEREAKRLTLLECFQPFASGAVSFRSHNLATDSTIARKPTLQYGTGFMLGYSREFEQSLKG